MKNLKEKILPLLPLILLAASYILWALYKTQFHFHIYEGDTPQFMSYAREIKETGGVLSFLKEMYLGNILQSNRHPIFPMLLSVFEAKNISWFINGKFLNIILGLFYIIIFYIIARKEKDINHAIMASVLLIFNDIFIWQSTMISAEPVIMIFTLLAVYYLYIGIDDNRYWCLAGVFTGLAYMSKASGLFIAFGFFLFLIFKTKFRLWKLLKNKYLWLYALAFLIVSSPLLVRNTIVYGFPFYNYNINMMAMTRAEWQHGVKTPDSFTAIFSKGVFTIVKRFFFGIKEEIRAIIYSLYTFSIYYVPKQTIDTNSLLVKLAAAFVGIINLILITIGVVTSKISKEKKWLLFFIFMGYFLPLSWYAATSPHRRYIIPITAILLLFSASTIIKLVSRIIEKWHLNLPQKQTGTFIAGTALLTTVIFTIILAISSSHINLKNSYRLEDGYDELARFLKTNLKKNEKFLQRDSSKNYSWQLLYPELYEKQVRFYNFNTWNEMDDFLKDHSEIKYILVDAVTRHFAYGALSPFIGKDTDAKYVRINDERGLWIKRDLPGWHAVMMESKAPTEFILFERK